MLTFVPVGNDGEAGKVRFPACASQAISVGSLTRDGTVAGFSNGRKTQMVDLYTDGETVVLPVRGPRLEKEEYGSGAGCWEVDPKSCRFRKADDQYDPQMAGGTLLSAAIASGSFLNVRERHPNATPEAILAAFEATSRSSSWGVIEVNEELAEQALDRGATP